MPLHRVKKLGLAGLTFAGCGPLANTPPATMPRVGTAVALPEHDPEADAIALFGKDFVRRVKTGDGIVTVGPGRWHVRLGGSVVTDSDLLRLVPVKGTLQSLDLEGSAVTADGLAALAGFDLVTLKLPAALKTDAGLRGYLTAVRGSERLDLTGWAVTDNGLRALAEIAPAFALDADEPGLRAGELDIDEPGIPNREPPPHRAPPPRSVGVPLVYRLKFLDLQRTKVTDAGVVWLAKVLADPAHAARLHTLDLSHTAVTDAGLAELAGITSLRHLVLEGTAVTDDGLAALPPGLEVLDLSGTMVTDAGMPALAGQQHLSVLSVSRTKVTDAGLEPLTRVGALHTVLVAGSLVTLAGATQFTARRPGVSVDSHTTTSAGRRSVITGGVTRGGFGSTGGSIGGAGA